jgi:hypothetical protein
MRRPNLTVRHGNKFRRASPPPGCVCEQAAASILLPDVAALFFFGIVNTSIAVRQA